jgi:DNA-binding HxlR family transcriptional regulator
MTVPSVWSGLGRRGDAAPQPDVDLEQDDQPFEHRVIPAAGAPSIVPADPMASPFTSWRRAGSAANADADRPAAAAPSQEEESTMPTEKATAAVPHNLQVRVVRVLAKVANMTREKINEQLPDLTEKQLSQALHQASAWGRVRRIKDATGVRAWEITSEGKQYLDAHGGDVSKAPAAATKGAATKRAAARKPAAPKRKAKPPAKRAKPGRKARQPRGATKELAAVAPVHAIATFEPELAHSFRCGIYSDGAFHLSKGEQRIELTVSESRRMLAYLERMAPDEAA